MDTRCHDIDVARVAVNKLIGSVAYRGHSPIVPLGMSLRCIAYLSAVQRFCAIVELCHNANMKQWLFGILSYLVFFLFWPFAVFHPKLRQGIQQRFGYTPIAPSSPIQKPKIWVHGASAGDILALLPTVRELKKSLPEVHIVASTITNSGYTIASKHSNCFDQVLYFPYDLPCACRRALARVKPSLVVLEYTELWPNFIHQANRQNIPLVLHNGRLASNKLKHYRKLFRVTGNLLKSFRILLMRDEYEAERARLLLAPNEIIVVTGNTKFDSLNVSSIERDTDPLRTLIVENGQPTSQIWVAGSTHEGEEEMLLDVFQKLRAEFVNLRMIIAPRYIERSERIQAQAQRRGLRSNLRSTAKTASDVLILNTLGELPDAYAIATVVFVGGSFVPRGGQNILEPAACKKVVLFGPNMQNFADSVQVLLGRGGIQVATPEQLLRIMRDLLQRPEHCSELGDMAYTQVRSVRGAARKNADRILTLLRQAHDSKNDLPHSRHPYC